jgi:hypothetical protein
MRTNLKTASFSEWNGVLEQALRLLPENWEGAHDFYETLGRAPIRKRIELVTRSDEPVAIVGLVPSYVAGVWQPLTEWIAPALVCPARPELFWQALQATNLSIRLGWRHQTLRLDRSVIRDSNLKDTYSVKFPFDYRAYWKTSGNGVNKNQKRCKHFTVKMDQPGTAEWVLTNWKRHWEPEHDGSEVRLRLAGATWLEAHGQHHTMVMYDGDTPIAGHTIASTPGGQVHLWQVSYKDPAYDSLSPGTALLGYLFEWIERNHPTSIFDLGLDHAYKLKWAPVRGQHLDVTVSPLVPYASRKAAGGIRVLKKKVLEMLAANRSR